MSEDRAPHPVDVAVGARVKARRVALGVSQAALAERLGLTFQQVQKYERGANRISASKLLEIAEALSMHPGDLFEGVAVRSAANVDYSLFLAPGVMELVLAFRKLAPHEQRAVLRLVQELIQADPSAARAG